MRPSSPNRFSLQRRTSHVFLFLVSSFGSSIYWSTQRTSAQYAALQSESGRALLEMYNAPTDLSTMVYVSDGVAHTRSEAMLLIGKQLGFVFGPPAQLTLLAVPRPLRDWAYTNLLAKYRYDVFGKREECRVADPGDEDLFL
jgi:predicted DCC family thiol-disulfide oxidoreductase YuxK